MSTWLLSIALASSVVAAPPAETCARPGHLPPKALVQATPLIVRARAVRFQGGEPVDDPRAALVLATLPRANAFGPEEREVLAEERPLVLRDTWGRVELEILEVVKGKARVGSTIATFGETITYAARTTRTVPYAEPRPLVREGDCWPLAYRLGAEYLLFLDRGHLSLVPRAPINEELEGPDDPWLRWVKSVLQPRYWREPPARS